MPEKNSTVSVRFAFSKRGIDMGIDQQDMVILVNEQDMEIGLMPKLEAHEKGLLHRAFSVFIFNTKGEILLQQRALNKYHSAGRWTNTCCSHPRHGEEIHEAAKRRLMEEMGLETDLTHLFSFVYKEPFENGLTEHEYDHVFAGVANETPVIDPEEAAGWRYASLEEIEAEIKKDPHSFSVWFKASYLKVFGQVRESGFV